MKIQVKLAPELTKRFNKGFIELELSFPIESGQVGEMQFLRFPNGTRYFITKDGLYTGGSCFLPSGEEISTL